MDDAELAAYRTRIEGILSDLKKENALGQTARKTVVLDQTSVGRLSRMDALQQQAMAQATQTRRNQTEQRIHAALARIKDGEFGYCIRCGELISPKRMALDPTIATCISCARG